MELPRMATAKTVVMGMLDRYTRQVRAKVIPNVSRITLQAEILKNLVPVARVYTDAHGGYERPRRSTLRSQDREPYAGIRSQAMFTLRELRTSGLCSREDLNGTYVAVEPFHLDRTWQSKFSATIIAQPKIIR